ERVLRADGPELEETAEDHPQDGEVRERLEDRPDVAERRARVLELELDAGAHPGDPDVVRESAMPRGEGLSGDSSVDGHARRLGYRTVRPARTRPGGRPRGRAG